MTIYLVIHEDRHVDVAVHPHLSLDTAIAHAKTIAADYEEAKETKVKAWPYSCQLSEEGDYVHVVAAEMLP